MSIEIYTNFEAYKPHLYFQKHNMLMSL